jgi:hypothetical protein
MVVGDIEVEPVRAAIHSPGEARFSRSADQSEV